MTDTVTAANAWGDAQLRADLIRDEGVRSVPYTDTTGNLTVGVGHNLNSLQNRAWPLPYSYPLSDAQIASILDNDIAAVIEQMDGVMSWWRTLSGERQRALIEMGFNLGVGKLTTFRTFMSYMQTGNYDAAAHDMLQTLWARQVGARANRLAELVASGPVTEIIKIPAQPAPKPKGNIMGDIFNSTIAGGLLRYLVGALVGVLVGKGWITADETATVTGAILAIGGGIWSVVANQQHAQLKAAVANSGQVVVPATATVPASLTSSR